MAPRIGPVESLTFDAAQAAQAMGVAKRYVEHLMAKGDLPSFKVGRRRLVLREDVTAFLYALRDEQNGLVSRLRAPAAPEPPKALEPLAA